MEFSMGSLTVHDLIDIWSPRKVKQASIEEIQWKLGKYVNFGAENSRGSTNRTNLFNLNI